MDRYDDHPKNVTQILNYVDPLIDMTTPPPVTLVAAALLLPMFVGCNPTDKQQAADNPPTRSQPTSKTPSPSLPAPPRPDTSNMEPEVAKRIETARKSCEDHPTSASTWGEYAMVLDVHNLAPEAIICYQRATRLDPDNFRLHYFLGITQATIDPVRAAEPLRRATELKPDYAPAHVRFADTLLLTSDMHNALKHYRRAIEIDPKNAFAHLGMAKIARVAGDTKATINHLHAAIQNAANLKEAYELLAVVQRRAGDEDAAQDAERRAKRIRRTTALPDPVRDTIAEYGVSGEWYVARGQSLQYSGNITAAIEAYKKAVAIRPSALHYYNLGAALGITSRQNEAIQAYDHAIELRPDYAEALFNRGVALAKMRRFTKAVESYERAIQADPNMHDARLNLATLLLSTGKTEEGIKHLRIAVDHMPDSVVAQFNLGMAYRNTGDLEQAGRAFKKAIEIEPDHIDSINNLGIVRARQGHPTDAIELFKKVIALNSIRTDAINNLAIAYTAAGQLPEAIDTFEKGHERLPDHPGMANKLAWLLATCPIDERRDGTRAVEIAERLCERSERKNPEHLDTLAAAYAENGRFEEAISAVTQAITIREKVNANDPRLKPYRLRLEQYKNRQPHRLSQ